MLNWGWRCHLILDGLSKELATKCMMKTTSRSKTVVEYLFSRTYGFDGAPSIYKYLRHLFQQAGKIFWRRWTLYPVKERERTCYSHMDHQTFPTIKPIGRCCNLAEVDVGMVHILIYTTAQQHSVCQQTNTIPLTFQNSISTFKVEQREVALGVKLSTCKFIWNAFKTEERVFTRKQVIDQETVEEIQFSTQPSNLSPRSMAL